MPESAIDKETAAETAPPTFQEQEDNGATEEKLNTDGRKPYHWESGYPREARTEIRREAIYVGIVLVISLLGLLFNWCGCFSGIPCLKGEKLLPFEGIMYYFFSGLLGGTIFGIKYFYRVVARGYWSQDRIYWRVFSPWISACIAVIVGCMVISGFINAAKSQSAATGICVGFVAGYFPDQAVGKMSEVATALFGNSSQSK